MENTRNKFRQIETAQAPKAIGPYSQGIVKDPFIFVSGQLPIDPAAGKLIEGGMKELTHRVLDNISAVLAAAGADLSHVIRVEVFLVDFARDLAEFNQAYSERFTTKPYPARQTVQVSALPMGSRIELSCIAVNTN